MMPPRSLALLACLAALVAAPCRAQLILRVDDDAATIGTAEQEVTFALGQPGAPLVATTRVRVGEAWPPLFGAPRPLVAGSAFDLAVDGCEVAADTPDRKALRLHGRSPSRGYEWECLVTADGPSPLLHFLLTAHLPTGLTLAEPQPTVALWLDGGEDAVTVGQGPVSIYGSEAPILGFPAAYVWRDGSEAVVFFDMTPMTWMSRSGVERFLDCRVEGRRHGDSLGLGLHTWKLTGPTIPPGDLAIRFFLYQGPRPERPTRLEALDTMVRVCAPLHPANGPTIPWPAGAPPSWGGIAAGAIDDLMHPGVTCEEQVAGWRDAPLELVAPVDTIVIHPDRPRAPDLEAPMGWDFSTVNNHLAAWTLYCRLHPERADAARLARTKKDALPLFYDPETRLIRWGTRVPPHLAGPDMAWQCLFFHHETMRTFDALAPDEFNPAIAGRFLMATRGLIELAHNTDYVLPQWFDPVAKTPATQQDVPELGTVREPWQLGSYAHLMLRANEVSGDPAYLAEAERSLHALLETMRYTVSNTRYTTEYADPADFPITEIHGNALGIVAAYRLFERTGDATYERYARWSLDSLLRMTFWYEDQTDAPSRDLDNLGLFLPFGGAVSATPWETNEAQLALAWILGHDRQMPPEVRALLLRLSSLHRRSALLFYSPTWSEEVRSIDPSLGDQFRYLPVEPFYSLEGGGHRGGRAAYMAGAALWDYWMYEALGRASDPEILVLNTDVHGGYEEALSGLERHFVLYNPAPEARAFTLEVLSLPPGAYALTADDGPPTALRVEGAAAATVALQLAPGASARLTLRREDAEEERARLRECHAARCALSRAYAALQESAGSGAATPAEGVDEFRRAMQAYRDGDYPRAEALALGACGTVGGPPRLTATTRQASWVRP